MLCEKKDKSENESVINCKECVLSEEEKMIHAKTSLTYGV